MKAKLHHERPEMLLTEPLEELSAAALSHNTPTFSETGKFRLKQDGEDRSYSTSILRAARCN